MVSWWGFNESSGNASDSHGSNTLTNVGSMPYVAAKIGNGADISKAGGKYLSRSSAVLTALDNISISCWVNISSTSISGSFFRVGTSGINYGWGIGIGGNEYRFNGNDLILLCDGIVWNKFGTIGSTGWKHIVVLRDAGTWKAYINGASFGTTFTTTPNSPDAFTYIGNDQGSFEEVVDEMAVWTRAITTSEITQLYNSGNGISYADTGATVNSGFFQFM